MANLSFWISLVEYIRDLTRIELGFAHNFLLISAAKPRSQENVMVTVTVITWPAARFVRGLANMVEVRVAGTITFTILFAGLLSK
jgi:hypothetical protein